jgi:hypothetical protein
MVGLPDELPFIENVRIGETTSIRRNAVRSGSADCLCGSDANRSVIEKVGIPATLWNTRDRIGLILLLRGSGNLQGSRVIPPKACRSWQINWCVVFYFMSIQIVFLKAPQSEEQIEICKFDPSGPVNVGTDITHLAFEVEDLDAFAKRVVSKGYPLSDGPTSTGSGSSFGFIDAPGAMKSN